MIQGNKNKDSPSLAASTTDGGVPPKAIDRVHMSQQGSARWRTAVCGLIFYIRMVPNSLFQMLTVSWLLSGFGARHVPKPQSPNPRP